MNELKVIKASPSNLETKMKEYFAFPDPIDCTTYVETPEECSRSFPVV